MSIASSPSKCAGAITGTGTGIAATGAGAATAGTAVTGAGTGITGTVVAGEAIVRKQKVAGSARLFSISGKTKPRVSGVLSLLVLTFSDRTAAPVTPGQANGAATFHDHRTLDHDAGPLDHNHFAIGNASLIGAAMEAGAASAGGIGGAKARDGACNHNCSEKIFHVFSLH
jgi:hypothetical protein